MINLIIKCIIINNNRRNDFSELIDLIGPKITISLFGKKERKKMFSVFFPSLRKHSLHYF